MDLDERSPLSGQPAVSPTRISTVVPLTGMLPLLAASKPLLSPRHGVADPPGCMIALIDTDLGGPTIGSCSSPTNCDAVQQCCRNAKGTNSAGAGAIFDICVVTKDASYDQISGCANQNGATCTASLHLLSPSLVPRQVTDPLGCMVDLLDTNTNGAKVGSCGTSTTDQCDAVLDCCNVNKGLTYGAPVEAGPKVCVVTKDSDYDLITGCATQEDANCKPAV